MSYLSIYADEDGPVVDYNGEKIQSGIGDIEMDFSKPGPVSVRFEVEVPTGSSSISFVPDVIELGSGFEGVVPTHTGKVH